MKRATPEQLIKVIEFPILPLSQKEKEEIAQKMIMENIEALFKNKKNIRKDLAGTFRVPTKGKDGK